MSDTPSTPPAGETSRSTRAASSTDGAITAGASSGTSSAAYVVYAILGLLFVFQAVWMIRSYRVGKDPRTPPSGGSSTIVGIAEGNGADAPLASEAGPAKHGPPSSPPPPPPPPREGTPEAPPGEAPPPGAPDRPARFFAPVDEMPKIINKIIALDGTNVPLDAAQRARLLPLAKKMVETCARAEKDLTRVVAVLRPDQARALRTPHPEVMARLDDGPRGKASGGNPLLARTIAVLRDAAAASSSTTSQASDAASTARGVSKVTLDRQLVCMGLLYLQGNPELALGPEQVKVVLEALEDCETQLSRLGRQQGEVMSVLTPAQIAAVEAQTVSSAEDMAARCLLYFLRDASR